MVKQLILCGTCVGLLSGCFQVNTSQAPLTTTYPISDQQKMQSAHHWDVLAEHEAKLISNSLAGYSTALHVSDEHLETPFDRGFNSLLTSQLVKQGAVVKSTEYNAATVSYDVEVVKHKDRDAMRKAPGTWTVLAGGIAVAAHAANYWGETSRLLIPAAIGADFLSGSWVKNSDFEVIITTKVIKNDRILHSSSNIYYINGGDSDHYAPSPETTKNIKVTG
nr:hypothetical protein [uncultured Amphritea sp.]